MDRNVNYENEGDVFEEEKGSRLGMAMDAAMAWRTRRWGGQGLGLGLALEIGERRLME